MVKKIQESKDKKAAKHSSTKEKKKWTSVSQKEAAKRSVVVSDDLLSKVEKDITKATLLTRFTIASKYNLNLSVAERLLKHFASKGIIQLTYSSKSLSCYTRPTAQREEVVAEPCPAN